MPITIKELHIRINVDEKSEAKGSDNEETTDQEAIVEACVEEVMHILEQQKER
ncbi:DUF5908 family protein [Tenacibaculum amylolyticum]|uniref:DUF5908 family protein n=1 Tax=Tenacibaculum amylolyticum TaxID=104269 RepID=UPI003893368C